MAAIETMEVLADSLEKEIKYTPINPLLVDLVMDKIFQYLPKEDLWTARRVCYKWNELATRDILKKPQKSFYFQENMEDFLETMKASVNLPFFNFSLCLGRFASDERKGILGNFFKICGQQMKQLELQMDRRAVGVNFFRSEELALKLPDLTSLESLKMWYDASVDEFVGQDHLNFFYPLLHNNMTRLSSLTFVNYSSIFENQVVTDLLCISISENTFPNLKQITLQAKITDENLKLLAKNKNKLERVELFFKNTDFNDDILQEFLESQKNSIKSLKITAGRLCKLPKLKNLAVLDLHTVESRQCPFSYENRSNFPQLKKIKLAAPMLSDVFQNPQRMCALPSVQKLKFYKHFENGNYPRTVVPYIPIVFPNLTKLRLKFTPHWVAAIFEHLVNLEELFLDENNLIRHEHDTVFTGMSSETCESLENHSDNYKNENVENLRIKASLIQLKNLKVLKLINLNRMSNGVKCTCTDITGYFAFLLMPNLKSVSTYLNGFSDQCLADMREKFEVTSSLDYLRRKQL